MTTKSTTSSIAWLMRFSNAVRVAVRNPFGCRALLPGQPLQGTVEMDVASMDEAE